MLLSAEVRWFWQGRCPQPVHDWFFKSGLPPGGGFSRVDKYVPQRGEAEISLKKRGAKPDFEVKGFVATRGSPELEPLAAHIEIWCKWSCTIPGLNLTNELLVTKTRWLRKFDTSNSSKCRGVATERDTPVWPNGSHFHVSQRKRAPLPSLHDGGSGCSAERDI
jgi:hypothetical protein